MVFKSLLVSVLCVTSHAFAEAKVAALERGVCNADNCARAVTGTFRGAATPIARINDCSSFFSFTISGAATISPTAIPAYASACSGTARYSSACSCASAKPVFTTVPQAQAQCTLSTPVDCERSVWGVKNSSGRWNTRCAMQPKSGYENSHLRPYSMPTMRPCYDACYNSCFNDFQCYALVYQRSNGACALFTSNELDNGAANYSWEDAPEDYVYTYFFPDPVGQR